MSKPLEEETQWLTVIKESRRCQRHWDLLHSFRLQAQEPKRNVGKTAGEAASGKLPLAWRLK